MSSWKRRALIILGVLLVVVIVAAALVYVFNAFLVHLWWFDSLGYAPYFWRRLLYPAAVFTTGVLVFFALFFVNFWIGAKYLGARRPAHAGAVESRGRPSERIYRTFQRRSLAVYLPLSLLLAIAVSLPLLFYWQTVLMYLFSPGLGIDDPVFGLDIGHYLFGLPFWELFTVYIAIALAVVLAGLVLLYWQEHRAMPRDHGRFRRGARIHLSLIIFLLFLVGVAALGEEALMLLYTHAHLPLFYGPGYEELWVALPLILAAAVLLLALGGLLLYTLNTRKGVKTLAAVAVLFAVVFVLRFTPWLSEPIAKFVVKPNELTRQGPYIADNIEATLKAYGLNDVETRQFPIREQARTEITPQLEVNLRNIPIWSEKGLLQVYRELQEIRPYYRFNRTDVGRYTLDGIYQQVFLAAREINLDNLPESLQTWVNRWLKYTHGYGIVMTPASQQLGDTTQWFARGIPPETSGGLTIDQPAIYYGNGKYNPVIAPNSSHEVDYAGQSKVHLTDYAGNGGVPVSSLFRKLMFALYFHSGDVLYTTQTNDRSKLLFRRNVQERLKALTPFLHLAPHPYLVVADGHLYWMQNAMTTSRWYPYSNPFDDSVAHFDEPFNYIRDSIKIVVDAYDGSVQYYVSDPSDPIADTYARLYPGLFKPIDAMPKALKEHVRYPKPMFDVQMAIYARYHQTDPETFYNQEDVWEFPTVPWRDEIERITSYYLTLNLINHDRFEYSLFVPMNPLGQGNMRALAAVGSDGKDYGHIVVHEFPKGKLVYGPAQVDAFIRQDPRITEQLTLWNQEGSRAYRGHMVVVPVDGVVSYIQGIFLKATGESHMPQLKRVIVSQGPLVVMGDSLRQGFQRMNALVERKSEHQPQQNLPPPQRPPQLLPGTSPGQ